MFDYKQRPFEKSVTDEQYDIAVGRKASSPTLPPSTPIESVCIVSGCYFEELPVYWPIVPPRIFRRHVEPCPLASRNYLDGK